LLYDELDFHLVSEEPSPLYMGELPRRWEEVPTRVVVNLCGVFPVGEPYGRIVHGMALLDVLDPDLVPERATFEAFLDAVHVYAASEPTYWHCHAGLNRSGLAVAAYLHRYRGLRISDAIGRLRAARTPMVLCNSVFERTLREWYGEDDEQDFDVVSLDTWLAEHGGGRGAL
jgi:hypothetical protein